MTLEQQIDAALDSVLRASGSALKYYTMQLTLDRMREAMHKVMSDAYIAGSKSSFNPAMKNIEALKVPITELFASEAQHADKSGGTEETI